MKKQFFAVLLMLASAVAVVNVSSAATVSQDFESSSLGSTTLPAGWSLVTVSTPPTPSYIVTAGASGAGLGGQVTARNTTTRDLPGGYYVNSGGLPFDVQQSISGSFNFNIVPGANGNYKNCHFIFGDIKTGITGSTSGQLLGAALVANTFGNKAYLVDGAATPVTSAVRVDDGIWYGASFTWTPTSGTTGTFSFSVSGAQNWTIDVNDFTFDSPVAYFGFGTAGYTSEGAGIFDDISITGTIIPESPAVPPEVSSIVDDDADDTLETYNPITYTVTFNEAMDDTTITTNDFTNSVAVSPATITVDSVTGSGSTYDVVVIPTSAGDLVLQVSSNVTDLSGNLMTNNVDDDTTITINDTVPSVTVITSTADGGDADVNVPMTYTVTFSETMDASTFATNDFVNADGGGAAITVDSVTPGTDTNVFTVDVTPTSTGSLTLRVSLGSVSDLSSTFTAVVHDDSPSLSVVADTTPPTVTDITNNVSPNPMSPGSLVTYTITFDEPIDASTVQAAGFANASNSTFSVDSITPLAGETNQLTVGIIPTSGVGLQLQFSSNTVADLNGNSNDVTSTDGTVITVIEPVPGNGTWIADANGDWSDLLNWQDNLIADGTNYTATLGNVITANRTITLDSDRTIGNITAADTSHNYSISGGNTLTLARTAGTPTITLPNNRTLAISSVIDGTNGLIKTGLGRLQMTGANTYSGGTSISNGELRIDADAALGDTSSSVTFLNTVPLYSTVNNVALNAARVIVVNSGCIAILGDPNINSNPLNFTINGRVTGDGGIQTGHYQLGSGQTYLNNTNNTFTGPVILGGSGITGKSWTYSTFGLNVASLDDGVGYGNIIFGPGNTGAGKVATFAWSAAAVEPLVLNNRQIELDNGDDYGALANNNASAANTITVNTDLQVSTANDTTFILGGSNTGDNTFAGVIADGAGSEISLTKSGSGKWILSGENTYSGITTINGGTLVIAGQYTLGDSNTVNIAGGKLEIGSMEKVGVLQFDGTPQGSGTYGSTSSYADNQDDARFTGTGVLYVGVDLPATGSVLRFK